MDTNIYSVTIDKNDAGAEEKKQNILENEYANSYEPPDAFCVEYIPPDALCDETKSFFDKNQDEVNLVRGVTYDEPELVCGVTYDEPGLVYGVTYDVAPIDICVSEIKNNSSKEPEKQITETNQIHQNVFTLMATQLMADMKNIPESEADIITGCEIGQPLEAVELNFSMKLIRKKIYVIDTAKGEIYKFEYVIAVTVQKRDGALETFVDSVPSNKVKGIDWLKTCTHSLAKIPSKKEEKEAYEAIVQKCIETDNVQTEIIYPTAGWRNIKNLGCRFVYADGIIGENNPLIHTAGNQNTLSVNEEEVFSEKTFKNAMGMMSICRNSPASAELVLFVHASMLSTLFENAGFSINFVFGIVGITNSRKTSMATAVAQVFDRQKLKANAEFATSTSCGIEKILGIYKDGVVIVDDFKPGANPAQSREMIKKLDEFVRLTGNRVEKIRMTEFMQDGDKKFFPITSCCVATMELVQGVTSTISRMFLTEIDADSVDNNRLAYYQHEKWILPTHMYAFLSWVTMNYDMVSGYIAQRFPKLRSHRKFAFGRYSEMYATLMISAEIIAKYAGDRMFWGEEQMAEFLSKTDQMLAYDLCLMGEKANQRDKTDLVKRAIQDAFLHGKIHCCQLTAENASTNADIYEDDVRVYIRANYVKSIVNTFCASNYEIFRVDGNDEVIDLLEKADLLDIAMTSRGKERARKLPIQKGNHLRYLYIPKEAINRLFIE